MQTATHHPVSQPLAGSATATSSAVLAPAHQAFRILQIGFVVAPTLAGLDKFLHLLTNWDKYLAPQVAAMLPISGHSFMLAVGVIEIAAGLLVALRPRIGGVVVGAWLLGIIVNLAMLGGYWDVALRDVGLALGAFALARLATSHEREHRTEHANVR